MRRRRTSYARGAQVQQRQEGRAIKKGIKTPPQAGDILIDLVVGQAIFFGKSEGILLGYWSGDAPEADKLEAVSKGQPFFYFNCFLSSKRVLKR